ncbi:MAG: winged helix-turn-helix domain-containing protein [Candidatus Thorarchaeota archaeon]
MDSELWTSASEIAFRIHVTTQTVLYHLKNMERERVVERDEDGRGWRLGPFEQSELLQYLSTKRKKK